MLLFTASLTLAVRLRQNTFRMRDFAPCIEDAFKMGRNCYIHSVAVNSNESEEELEMSLEMSEVCA